MSDGKLVFLTKIDNSQVAKDLKRLEKKIRQAEESISKHENAKLPLVNQSKELGARLDEAKARAELLHKEIAAINNAMAPGSAPGDYAAASTRLPQAQEALKAQEKEVSTLQKQWDSLNNKIDVYDSKIKIAKDSIASNSAQASVLSAQMTSSGAKMSAAFAKARVSADKFRKQILRVGASMIMFRVFSAVMQGISQYMGKILKTNEEYTAQLAQLKAALATAFQPIYDFILPGLMAVMRVLTAIVSVVANVLSFFSGKTAAQSAQNAKALNDEAEAIGAVGGAAKDAQKQLANFDEINSLGTPDTGGGGGGGGSVDISPDFEGMDNLTDSMSNLLGIVAAIGAALLTWNIAKSFTSTLSLAAGLALAVGGVFLYAFNWADAFANGIDWSNLNLMLAGMLAIIGGLYLAFGTVGAAIGALVTGVGVVIVALKDFQKTGELSDETLMAIATGILAIGGGIALLTGSWIPLAVAGVIALVSTLATEFNWIKVFIMEPLAKTLLNLWEAITDGAWDMLNALKQVFNGIAQFIGGIFRGSIKDAVNGIISILNGFISSFYAAINSIIRGINAISVKVPDWVPEFGGQTWGPNLDLLTVPQIPLLAQGAVLPANKPFLAMVGDQKNGTNVEAPLETIKQALAEVMAMYGGSNGDIVIRFEGDLAQLARILKPVIEMENKRVGPSLAGGNVQ